MGMKVLEDKSAEEGFWGIGTDRRLEENA